MFFWSRSFFPFIIEQHFEAAFYSHTGGGGICQGHFFVEKVPRKLVHIFLPALLNSRSFCIFYSTFSNPKILAPNFFHAIECIFFEDLSPIYQRGFSAVINLSRLHLYPTLHSFF